jgi:hypothetical protein
LLAATPFSFHGIFTDMIKTNEGTLDRIIRAALGLALMFIAYIYTTGVVFALLTALGLISLITGITGFCGLYSLLGINTCPIKKR